MISKNLIFISLFSVKLFAQTPFILEHFNTAHIVVKTDKSELLNQYKTDIYKLLYEYASDSNITISNLASRVLGVDVKFVNITQESTIIDLELFIHEPALRIEDQEEIFSITYQKRLIFCVNDLEEDLDDHLTTLLEEFSTQYEEDNE